MVRSRGDGEGNVPRSVWTTARALLAALSALAVLDANPAGAQSLQPAGWDAGMRMAEAVDRNPDPNVVEVDFEARVATVEIAPGLKVDAWTYNGTIPGPMIRVKVGDRLIVHFTNNLPRPSTIHWHGLRVPIAMDGVPGYSQEPVQPGGTFTYDFVVPDAGIFWYHPHVMSAAQVGFGLYGAFLVEDSTETETIGIADNLVLVLSDIDVDDDGALLPADTGGTVGMLFGREGNRVLVNGRRLPELVARSGAPQRWRVVNAAKSRYFKLDLGEGHVFRKIGGDGGLTEYSEDHDFIVLGAGERADVLVTPTGEPGGEGLVRSLLHDRGYGSIFGRDFESLFTIRFADEPPYDSGPLPRTSREMEPYDLDGATGIDLELTLQEDPYDRTFAYGINHVPFWRAKPILAGLGETQVWNVTNSTAWSHPLHLHGFFFLVLDEDGEPVRPLEWKDTVDIPHERTVRLAVRFDERPGTWIFHCHILDHADGGLLSAVHLGLPPEEFRNLAEH
ncbi:MAG: multicopper oxidase family protein [Acidobacteria bacterium]|nr:multicopper oxidase family protein [Acidobacteriota bacterium]MYH28411.1 multicopper oxidase family protein [Acidobacteriota bacterium]MYK88714.1 multicopper oxidase family protein [Acidobacteriota bacterium]